MVSSTGRQQMCGAATADVIEPEVQRIHEASDHPGIKRTRYFCSRMHPSVTRRQVQAVVIRCDTCKSVDPAPVRWEPGELSVSECWKRVGIDVCHVGQNHYLSLIDCGPSRFAIWRKLRRQDASATIEQLELIFCERGPPDELLPWTMLRVFVVRRSAGSLLGGASGFDFVAPMYHWETG